MKRYLVFLLVITLLIGSSYNTFAKQNGNGKGNGNAYGKQHKNEEKAQILYDLGLFSGKSSTDFVPDLDSLSTRAEAIVLIGRSLDWPVEDITSVAGFNDVPSWAAPYVQYALDNNITKGTGHNKFGAHLPVNARMIYTWYYRALLYSGDSWDNIDLLVKAGLLTQEQLDNLKDALTGVTDNSVIRDEIIGIMFDSMQWKEKGSNQRLIQKLINRGRVSRIKARDCGLWTLASEVNFDVTADSLKAVKVEFDQNIDTSTVSGDLINVKVNDVEKEFGTDYTIETDESSIYIIFNKLLSQGSEVTVGFEEGILSVDGVAVTSDSKSAVVNDEEAPYISNIDLVNSKTINILFSEPMNIDANILKAYIIIDSSAVKGTFSINASKTKAVLTLNDSDSLDSGSHTVQVVKGLTDYAGLKTAAYSKTFGLSDIILPYIVSATAEVRDSIEIQFNEPINEDKGYILVGQNQYYIKDADVNGNLVTLSLTVPLTSDSATTGILLTARGIEDLSGNTVDTTSGLYFILKALNDTTPPVATVRITTDKTIEVKFSEEIDGFTSADYVLVDSNSNVVPTTVSYDNEENKATINLTSLPDEEQTYTLTILNTVLDNSVNQNPFVTKSYQLQI